jgi:hypothetical protein
LDALAVAAPGRRDVNPIRAPSLDAPDVFPRHRLLRRPGGFESFLATHKATLVHDLAIPKRPDLPELPRCLQAALFPSPAHGQRGQHLVARVGQLGIYMASSNASRSQARIRL